MPAHIVRTDVVLVGIDARSMRHPATPYVGASRARAALYVLALADAGLRVMRNTPEAPSAPPPQEGAPRAALRSQLHGCPGKDMHNAKG